MSSPIAIPASSNRDAARERAHSPISRSLHGDSNGLYVPVHRRNASTASAPSSFHGRDRANMTTSLSPKTRSARPPRSPVTRPRSVSPAPATDHHHESSPIPLAATRSARIPPAKTTIPNTYTIPELLALSLASSLSSALSPAQQAAIEAHIPLMTRRLSRRSSTPSTPSITAHQTPNPTESKPLEGPAPTKAPKADAPSLTRRRRTGRKGPNSKGRVFPAVSADVDNRRRRTVPGHASWGWVAASAPLGASDSWRAHEPAHVQVQVQTVAA